MEPDQDQSRSDETDDKSSRKGRRQWSRFTEEEEAVLILLPEGEVLAMIVDESFSGVGLEVRGDLRFKVGQRLGLRYRGGPMAGIVKFVMPADGGRTRLGVQWTDIAPSR